MHLLDANVLIALLSSSHQHNLAARRWFGTGRLIASCSITQMSLLRFLVRTGVPIDQALQALDSVRTRDDHTHLSDSIQPDADNMRGVIGHRQVTDAYIAALAGEHSCRVATIDSGYAAAHPGVVDLIDT